MRHRREVRERKAGIRWARLLVAPAAEKFCQEVTVDPGRNVREQVRGFMVGLDWGFRAEPPGGG